MSNQTISGDPLTLKKYEENKIRKSLDELYNLIKSNKNAFPNSLPLFDEFYTKYEKDNRELKKKLDNIIDYLNKLKLENDSTDIDIKKINKDIKEIKNQIREIPK